MLDDALSRLLAADFDYRRAAGEVARAAADLAAVTDLEAAEGPSPRLAAAEADARADWEAWRAAAAEADRNKAAARRDVGYVLLAAFDVARRADPGLVAALVAPELAPVGRAVEGLAAEVARLRHQVEQLRAENWQMANTILDIQDAQREGGHGPEHHRGGPEGAGERERVTIPFRGVV